MKDKKEYNIQKPIFNHSYDFFINKKCSKNRHYYDIKTFMFRCDTKYFQINCFCGKKIKIIKNNEEL